MPQSRRFVFLDGREVEAASPLGFFEALRRTERIPPADLGRYLDLLQSRGTLFYGIELDVGDRAWEISTRCHTALASLMSNGWVRVKPRRQAAHGPGLQLA